MAIILGPYYGRSRVMWTQLLTLNRSLLQTPFEGPQQRRRRLQLFYEVFASPAACLTSQPSASPPDMDAVALGNRSASCKDAGTKPKALSPPVARESDPYPFLGNSDPARGGWPFSPPPNPTHGTGPYNSMWYSSGNSRGRAP